MNPRRPDRRARPRVVTSALLLALVAVASLAACRGRPVTDADREVLLRVRDLAPYGVELPGAARHETFEKVRYFDGSTELAYEFMLPDDWQGPGVYISVTASVERDESSATYAYGAEKIGVRAAANLGDLVYEERPGFFPYGDQSAFYVIKSGGKQLGNYFITRFGTRVYSVTLTGIHFYEPETWGELIKPKLEKFAAYNP